MTDGSATRDLRPALPGAEGRAGPGPGLIAGGVLTATALMWGSMIPVTGRLLERVDPFTIAAARYVLALPVLALLAVLTDRRRPDVPRAPVPWGRVALLGGPGLASFAILYVLGIRWSDPITAAAVTPAGPIVAVLMAWALKGVRPTRALVFGVVAAVGGGVLVGLGRPSLIGGLPAPRGGEVLMLAALVIWTWYAIRVQDWLAAAGMSQLRATLATSTVGAALLVAIAAGVHLAGLAEHPLAWPGWDGMAMLGWIGLVVTGLGIWTYNLGAARVGVPVAALYVNMAPVFAVVLAVSWGAAFTSLQLAGGALVLAGVLWTQWRGLRAR